uniref:Protein kinase domain-containing protein n=1 Tax=Macrostomum lignano TaxID=282301 RepID=A0A1I8JNL7_9PLAT
KVAVLQSRHQPGQCGSGALTRRFLPIGLTRRGPAYGANADISRERGRQRAAVAPGVAEPRMQNSPTERRRHSASASNDTLINNRAHRQHPVGTVELRQETLNNATIRFHLVCRARARKKLKAVTNDHVAISDTRLWRLWPRVIRPGLSPPHRPPHWAACGAENSAKLQAVSPTAAVEVQVLDRSEADMNDSGDCALTKRNKFPRISLGLVRKFAQPSCAACGCCTHKGIVHCDLKPPAVSGENEQKQLGLHHGDAKACPPKGLLERSTRSNVFFTAIPDSVALTKTEDARRGNRDTAHIGQSEATSRTEETEELSGLGVSRMSSE